MSKKNYVKPKFSNPDESPSGIPTIIAMGLAGLAVGAASAVVAKAVGIDRKLKDDNLQPVQG